MSIEIHATNVRSLLFIYKSYFLSGFDLKLGQRSVILDPVRNNFYVCFPRGSK